MNGFHWKERLLLKEMASTKERLQVKEMASAKRNEFL